MGHYNESIMVARQMGLVWLQTPLPDAPYQGTSIPRAQCRNAMKFMTGGGPPGLSPGDVG